jgi:hypothetical protein
LLRNFRQAPSWAFRTRIYPGLLIKRVSNV